MEKEDVVAQAWQKLSAWSILHFFVHGLWSSTSILIGFFAFNATMDIESQFDYFTAAILVLVLLILIGSILRFLYFRYQMLDDGIQVRQGVLFKNHLNLKFERIQNVNINHPIYFRPLKLVTLKIDGAGSKTEEILIAALTLDNAKAIRQNVQLKKGQLQFDSAEDGELDIASEMESSEEGEKFYTRSMADLVIHGLTNNRAWLVLGAIAGFLQSTPFSLSSVLEILQNFINSLISSESIAYLTLLLILSFVLAVVSTALFSVLSSIITYYGFTLYRSPKSLMVHRGLINKHEINLQKSRVQTIYFRQDWLDLFLKRVNVIFEQITHNLHDMDGSANSKKILVPSARESERSDLAAELFDVPDVAEMQFHGISKRYFYKLSIIWSILYAPIAVTVVLTIGLGYLALLATIYSMHIFLLYMTWRRAGIVRADDYIIVRKGIIGIDYVIFPAYKLQAIDHVQSIFMKKRNLSNVTFHTAARTVGIPYLPTQFVKDIVNYSLYSVEANSRSWM